MKIIVDAMGGDNAPQAIVEGALNAARELDVEVVLVGRTEADPLKGKISDESPVGHALLGKAVGEEAEVLLPNGQTVIYKVLAITHAAN